ncbi:MAG: aldo/keto reductase [Nitrospinaceae bacterium]|nr:MAG: aldo/keto reductase [Nitrospinaceae bacterium]
MEYRKLGDSDLEVSAIGFGAWGIGGAPFWKTEGDPASMKALRKAVDAGINFFDTAPVYGFGHSEELLGKALKPVRDRVILASKCGLRWSRKALGAITKNASRASIEEEVEGSLQRLGTDRIDLYQVHWPDVNTPQQETMEALLGLQRKGKIRHFGVSNYSLEQMKDAMQNGRFIALQPEYNLLSRGIEAEVVPWCLENGIGIVAYSSLASGVLTGKYGKATRFTDWRSKGIIGTFQGEAYERNIDKVERLAALAKASGRTAAQVAVNWVLRQPAVATALVGVKNARQIEENLSAVGWAPAPDVDARLNEVFARK